MKVLFFGTPSFAVPSLQAIKQSKHHILAVITSPDMPAGRGLQLKMPEVKIAAMEYDLPVWQPQSLSDPDFIQQCKDLKPDIAVVVAFRKLPDEVWTIPAKGTFNLHASLLPQYRGAAPINRAIMNGETQTGLTTFFINDRIDTGNIIQSITLHIGPDEHFGSLYDRMSLLGAQLVIRTLDDIEQGNMTTLSQETIIRDQSFGVLMKAPKILKSDCRIQWNRTAPEIFNQIRGLSPVPGAFSVLVHQSGKQVSLKILNALMVDHEPVPPGGLVVTKDEVVVGTGDSGCLKLIEVCPESKSRMPVQSFLNGLHDRTGWSFEIF
jgi:methionyl-tRNA formyltransferase